MGVQFQGRQASPPEQSKTPKDLSFGVLARFRLKLERKSHSCTNVGNIAEILVAVKVASVDEDPDVIGEAVLKTASDISVTVDIPIPRGATARHYIGSEVPGANGIAEEEVSASGQMECHSAAIKPGCLVSDTEVAEEEEVQAKSTTGAGVEYASMGAEEVGVEGIHLKFKIAESAGGFGDDDRLYFLIRLSVAGKGAAK